MVDTLLRWTTVPQANLHNVVVEHTDILSLNRQLYKMDTSVKRTPGDDPCLFLLIYVNLLFTRQTPL